METKRKERERVKNRNKIKTGEYAWKGRKIIKDMRKPRSGIRKIIERK